MSDTQAMSCPVCRVPLVMSDRQGVEIDYCPQCRGVWLDRGELDKIIERNAREYAAPPQPGPAPSQPPRSDYDAGYGRHHGGHHPKRRKSFLEELFD
jgi:Zn-finger nucleic acid-binding protein